MASPYKNAATAAVAALQKWYEIDPFAQSVGLYHYDDPTISGAFTFLLNMTGYLDAYQDMERWWNSANAITALIDYMSIANDYTYLGVIADTFAKAPNGYSISKPKVVSAGTTGAIIGGIGGAILGTVLGPVGAVLAPVLGAVGGGAAGAIIAAGTFARTYYTNFLDTFYDDDGWWALALIRGYDVTKVEKYLEQAVYIFNTMVEGWDEICGGGIYWSTNHQDTDGNSPYKNAIANELFMAVGAALYLRYKALNPNGPIPPAVQSYKDWAIQEWQWFSAKGLINSSNLVNDSLTTAQAGPSCINNGSEPVWTYNQGVILGALCDLAEITGDASYLVQAEKIADALIEAHTFVSPNAKIGSASGITDDGILQEWSELGTGENLDTSVDHCQFKGIFVRNLAYLYTKTNNPRYRAFILKNAASALRNKNSSYQFGYHWYALPDATDFVRQTSVVDLFNAAMVVQPIPPNISYLESLLLNDKRKAGDLAYLDPLLLRHNL